jgi:hypothetical protein
MGQTHVHKYMRPLLERIERGEIDPSFVITHHFKLEDAPQAYKTFHAKEDGCIKVVLDPWLEAGVSTAETVDRALPADTDSAEKTIV